MRRSPLRSPPRVRGKVPVCCPEHRKVRITPAYAGKRRRRWASGSQDRDHPRVCGEKSANPKVRDTMEGASPRMRGKVFFFTGASFYAIFFLEPSGNLLLEPSGSSWVPPDGSIFVFAIGSPPRVRGKVKVQSTLRLERRDHPRVCGEKGRKMKQQFIGLGSPPRVRGKAVLRVALCIGVGITPAYAGKSRTGLYGNTGGRDHPRVCGEKKFTFDAGKLIPGSPPRMRGKALQLPLCILDMRITPAYAGKSNTFLCKGLTARDHPRVCGEKGLIKVSACGREGSPPRMRGKAVPLRSATASGCRGPSVPEYDAPP